MSETNDHQNGHERDAIIYGGLLGVNIAVVVQLLQVPKLDSALQIALHFCAAAIPLLTLHTLRIMVEQRFGQYQSDRGAFFAVSRFLGPLLTVATIDFLFFHFTILSGVLFAVLVCVALVAILGLYGKMMGKGRT